MTKKSEKFKKEWGGVVGKSGQAVGAKQLGESEAVITQTETEIMDTNWQLLPFPTLLRVDCIKKD